MKTVKLLTLAALLALPSALSAQGFANAGIDFLGGVAMPNGDFGDDEGDDAGFATTGFFVGANMRAGLGATPFSWISSVSINSLGADAEEAFGDDADFGRYWLVPITTGVGYPIAMGTGMSLTPHAQIGVNIAYGPNGEIGDEEFETATSFSLAFSAGADFMFTPTLGATARLMNGGGPEREIDAGDAGEGELETTMTFLQLGIVFKFR